MRTDKELLRLLLAAVQSKEFKTGLCSLVDFTLSFGTGALNNEEYLRLHKILQDNKPVTHDRRKLYWWVPGHRTPRIEFLNNLILKYDGNIR